jgi:4-hydroxy-3-methylbut-2-en-1-yl diphosphate synthase IspG/GcpE
MTKKVREMTAIRNYHILSSAYGPVGPLGLGLGTASMSGAATVKSSEVTIRMLRQELGTTVATVPEAATKSASSAKATEKSRLA